MPYQYTRRRKPQKTRWDRLKQKSNKPRSRSRRNSRSRSPSPSVYSSSSSSRSPSVRSLSSLSSTLSDSSTSTISDADLDRIIHSMSLSPEKRAELEAMRPALKNMRYTRSYTSCFTGNPTMNLYDMISTKISCWAKYDDEIY